MTERSLPQGTGVLWIAAIAIAFALLIMRGVDVKESETRQSCMDSVVTPDPEAIDYDEQALDFQAEIRRCLRG